jgi:hypothetical protein
MGRIKYLIIFLLFLSSNANSNHDTFHYYFNFFHNRTEIPGSQNYYKFKKELTHDPFVEEQLNDFKTGLFSYLFYKDGKILIDQHSLPAYIVNNQGLITSNSVGKSLVSYLTGYAICGGYIENIDTQLNDWSLVKNTLYENQKLIDILNMKAGDQNYIGEYYYDKNYNDNILKKERVSVNQMSIKDIMDFSFQNTKKSSSVYNYNALATNVVMNYVIYKVGNDYKKLLKKIFQEDAKTMGNVYFLGNGIDPVNGTSWYGFYASRYDYLRIAKAMMDHWNNDTCVGKYLKTIYDRRIQKNLQEYRATHLHAYSYRYGGQFHFDILGMEKRKILGLDGFGGQQILIDVEKKAILVVNATTTHYNWSKIVHKRFKDLE